MTATDTTNELPPSVQPPEAAAVRTAGWPWFTLLLIALLGLIFVFEIGLNDGTGTTPTTTTLTMLGGLFRPLVLAGEWWRIFTGPLLHADPSHIFFNCVALLLIGVRLEPLVGWRWFAAIFSLSAICGSVLSLVINAPNMVGIGASGGIVGLFVAALILVSRIPDSRLRMRLIRTSASALVPALLPFIGGISSGSANIDYGAHFGGAIGGAIMGIVLLGLWPKALSRPTNGRWAAVFAAAFFVVAAGALIPISRNQAEIALLVPDWPHDAQELNSRAKDLAAQYPHDPRARLTYAGVLLVDNQPAAAETELRAALAETDLLRHHFTPAFEDVIRGYLATVLFMENKTDEAKATAQPSCGHADLPADLKTEFDKDKLCP